MGDSKYQLYIPFKRVLVMLYTISYPFPVLFLALF